jgi:DNA/RNA-binding domain of Phe-tRNA-synthetase-like protein
MISISIEPALKAQLPQLVLGGFSIKVRTEASSDDLKELLRQEVSVLEKHLTVEGVRNMDTVKATKDAYRKLGKDPNRYRPSSEALLRRVANGKGLYHINNVVDVLNLISVKTGFSICGYDGDMIDGDVVLGIGQPNEPYEGIGRGVLNIERLPVFRDTKGAFGTPTSDSVRTMVTESTCRFVMVIMAFGNMDELALALKEAIGLYEKYADGSDPEMLFVES